MGFFRRLKLPGNGHNGGRSQIGLNLTQYGAAFPFLNHLKTAQNWALADGSAWPEPDTLDSNGYPISISNGGVTTVFDIPSQTARPGNWVVAWDGNGTIDSSGTVLPTVTFTGSVTAGVLTAGAPSGGSIQKGMPISYSGSTLYQAIIGDQLTGSAGLAGTYQMVGVTTVSSQTITASGGSKTSSTGTGRYVVSGASVTFNLNITAIGSPRITNARVFHVDDEALLAAGNVFGVKFLERLVAAKFGVIRFMQWQLNNISNMTNWASRKPESYVFYSGSEMRPSIYAGHTSNTGGAFSATLSGFTLVDKALVTVKFMADYGGADITMNISGTGAVPVVNHYCATIDGDSSWYVHANDYRSIATLMYDARLGKYIKIGGDSARQSVGIDNGVPPELYLRLCVEVGAHPYICTPIWAADPATDYMPSFAALCRDTGPSWMVPRFEGVNETWNNFSGFYQTSYFAKLATAYGWGTDYNEVYGKALSVMGQQISTVYSADRSKYQVICGVKTGTADSPGNIANSNSRLASVQYLASAEAPQSPFTKSAAKDWVTHICPANYMTPSDYGTAAETTAATNWAAAAGNPSLQASIIASYVATLNSGSGISTISANLTLWTNWKAWAQGYGIQKMAFYEGGYSPDYLGDGRDAFRAASKQDTQLVTFTATLYANAVGLSDGTFTAEYPSHYHFSSRAGVDGGGNPRGEAWALLEDVYQSPNPPQWDAIVTFNA